MKRNSTICIVGILACMGLAFGACHKDDPVTPINPVTDSTDTVVPADTTATQTDTTSALLGHWYLTEAYQMASGNYVDMTPWYDNFQLIFEADGTLITTDGINSTEMNWAYENGILGFIQTAGLPAIDYHIMHISADSLSIQDQRDPDYVTTMNFVR